VSRTISGRTTAFTNPSASAAIASVGPEATWIPGTTYAAAPSAMAVTSQCRMKRAMVRQA
jgi:hypothetical protein